jgi:hypothetical protein
MSEQPAGPATLPPSTGDAGDRPLLDLVGLAAYVHLGLFGLVGEHTWGAPDLAAAQTLVSLAHRVAHHQEALLAIGGERGVDAVTLMAPYAGILDPFDARTPESSWWEGLLKGVVGHGVSTDLCRLLGRGLPGDGAAAVGAVLADDDSGSATALVRAAADADPVLASRLALWGRRVVDESLSLAQELIATREPFGKLARAAATASGQEPDGDATAWVLGELTAEHTRRMDRMGLAA